MRSWRGSAALAAYYLWTPVFAFLDLGLGLSVRVAGLDRPLHRGAWYVAATALGILARARPRTAPWIGMVESVANLLLLLLSILLPVWGAADALLAGGDPAAPFPPGRVVNALLSGSVLVLAFQRNQAAARAVARR